MVAKLVNARTQDGSNEADKTKQKCGIRLIPGVRPMKVSNENGTLYAGSNPVHLTCDLTLSMEVDRLSGVPIDYREDNSFRA